MKDASGLYASCPRKVRIVEVGPRDGLQNESTPVPTPSKVAFIEALVEAGVEHVEVSSFVRPDKVPQLADAEDVFRNLKRRAGVTYSALVPNLRGLLRAQSVGVDSVALITAASETFNRKNIGCGTRESIERMHPVVEKARSSNTKLRAYVSTAFVCPYEGDVDPEDVAGIVRELRALGIGNISLGDTTGAAYPDRVSRLLEVLRNEGSLEDIALHLHDTFQRALPNALAGLLQGVNEFDSSAGGLGGCPFAPGARGNVATERLVDFFEGQGIEAVVDGRKIEAALEQLPEELRRGRRTVHR